MFSSLNRIFATSSPTRCAYGSHTEGGTLHIKGVTDALFLVLETSSFRIAIGNRRRGDALGSVVYAHPKCAGGLVPSRTLYGVTIYFLTWVFDSVLFIAKVVEDLDNKQADGKHLVYCM